MRLHYQRIILWTKKRGYSSRLIVNQHIENRLALDLMRLAVQCGHPSCDDVIQFRLVRPEFVPCP